MHRFVKIKFMYYNTYTKGSYYMFADEVILEVNAGNGGDRCMAFGREK